MSEQYENSFVAASASQSQSQAELAKVAAGAAGVVAVAGTAVVLSPAIMALVNKNASGSAARGSRGGSKASADTVRHPPSRSTSESFHESFSTDPTTTTVAEPVASIATAATVADKESHSPSPSQSTYGDSFVADGDEVDIAGQSGGSIGEDIDVASAALAHMSLSHEHIEASLASAAAEIAAMAAAAQAADEAAAAVAVANEPSPHPSLNLLRQFQPLLQKY